MSQTRKNIGFPTNHVQGNDFLYDQGYSSGGGAGICFNPATFSYMYWAIKVPSSSVRNTELVLSNSGFAPFTDGPGLCAHNQGSQAGFDVLLLHQAPTTILDRSLATAIVTIPSTATFPYSLDFIEQDLPQPIDATYEQKIWVALDFHTTGYMIKGLPQQFEAMQTVKINKEVSQ